jgi:DnaJ-class molecular chaperone
MQTECPKCRGKGKTMEAKCEHCRGKRVVNDDKHISFKVERGMKHSDTVNM